MAVMSLADLNDRAELVVSAYLAAFLPWGVLSVIDFISPKWKPIGETRRSGLIHLFISIFPLGVVLFYVHVQQLAHDYKEMMAALVAALLCMFHIARTLWGLAQLQAYRTWCTRALVCIYRMGYANRVKDARFQSYEDWRHQIMHLYQTATRSTNDNADLASFADTQVLAYMLVNNSLIDNEFIGMELPVRLSYPRHGLKRGLSNLLRGNTEDWICSRSLVQCTIRWTLSFLSQFGREWVDAYSVCDNIPDSLKKTGAHIFKKGKKVQSYFELLDNVTFDKLEISENALPYSSDVLSDFDQVLEAHRETLANQLKFYNAGVLDNLDYLLSAKMCEEGKTASTNERIDSISRITTSHLSAFLKLMSIIDRAEDEKHYEEHCTENGPTWRKRCIPAAVPIEIEQQSRVNAVIQKRVSAAEDLSFIVATNHV